MLTVEGISSAKIVRLRKSATKVHIRENRIIVLPVNILTGVAHRLLGPHDTLPCVLIDNKKNYVSKYTHVVVAWSDVGAIWGCEEGRLLF